MLTLVGRAGFEPAKLYKSHARLNLIESYYSESRVPSSKSNTVKHGVTVRVFGHFTTYPILIYGVPSETRTPDPMIKSHVLYLLS